MRRKKRSMVLKAMTSSVVRYAEMVKQGVVSPDGAVPPPNVERPSVRRSMLSTWCSAAVVAGEDVVSSAAESEVAVLGRATGM